MKHIFLTCLFLVSLPSFAAKVDCASASGVSLSVVQNGPNLTVIVNGESVPADGALTMEEVDIVAKTRYLGELTLFAKVGKNLPENYLFFRGQRISIFCR